MSVFSSHPLDVVFFGTRSTSDFIYKPESQGVQPMKRHVILLMGFSLIVINNYISVFLLNYLSDKNSIFQF